MSEKKLTGKKSSAVAKKRLGKKKVAKKKAGKSSRRSKATAKTVIEEPQIEPIEASTAETAKGSLELAAQLSIQNIEDLTTQLSPFFEANGTIKIDATKVETVDTAALQILVSFFNSARAKDLVLEWQGAFSALKELSELANLDQYFDFGAAAIVDNDEGLCPVF